MGYCVFQGKFHCRDPGEFSVPCVVYPFVYAIVDFPMNSLRVSPLGHHCCLRTSMMFACFHLILLYFSGKQLGPRYSIYLRIWKSCDLMLGEHVIWMWMCERDLEFVSGCFSGMNSWVSMLPLCFTICLWSYGGIDFGTSLYFSLLAGTSVPLLPWRRVMV